MHVHDAIKTRKSVRSFSKKKVSLKIIKTVLEISANSPSGSNTQPWNVHILTGKTLNSFKKASKKHFLKNSKNLKLERLNYMQKYRDPYLSRRRKVGWDLYNILNIKKGDYENTQLFHAKNYEFFGAPVGLIFSIEKDLGWMSWLDYGMFLQNITLSCRGFGLHTCAQAAWGLIYKKVNTLLKLDNNFTVHCGMAIGYENTKDKVNSLVTERAKVSEFCKILK